MSSLDNFHTNHGSQPHYPSRSQRMYALRQALHSSQSRDWDLASAVPVAPVQPTSDPARHHMSYPSAQVEERLSTRAMKDYLVPTTPRTYARRGDTVEQSVHILDTGSTTKSGSLGRIWQSLLGERRARVNTVSRFHPYVR